MAPLYPSGITIGILLGHLSPLAYGLNVTVKSAYRSAFTKTASSFHPSVVVNRRVWKKIWQAKMPNSAKVNAWKIGHNILPTLDRLSSRQVILESRTCVLCHAEDETIIHLCRNCPYSREVLATTSCLGSYCFGVESDHLDALSWLTFCSDKLSKTAFAQLLFYIWGLWKERNTRVWDNKTTSSADVALLCSIRLSNYVLYNSKVQRVHNMRRSPTWKAPPQSWLKINFDGAFNSGNGKAAVGVLIRDEFGACLGALGSVFPILQSAEHAELMACRVAVDYVISHQLHPVIFETDCLNLQQQLCQRMGQNFSTLGRIYDDIREDLETLPNSRLEYARRETNRAAHLLAAHASANDQNFFWPTAPFFIQDVIASEMLVS